jgi:hypothetical protein
VCPFLTKFLPRHENQFLASLSTAGYLSNFSHKFPIDYHQDFLYVGAFERFRVSCGEGSRQPKHPAIR